MCAITVNHREMLDAFKGQFTKAANSLSARLCTTHFYMYQSWLSEAILEQFTNTVTQSAPRQFELPTYEVKNGKW